MTKLVFQIVRDGAARWLIWKIGDPSRATGGVSREYEEYARVVEVDGLWYVEEPQWADAGISGWERKARGWMTKDGAIRSVTHPKKALAS